MVYLIFKYMYFATDRQTTDGRTMQQCISKCDVFFLGGGKNDTQKLSEDGTEQWRGVMSIDISHLLTPVAYTCHHALRRALPATDTSFYHETLGWTGAAIRRPSVLCLRTMSRPVRGIGYRYRQNWNSCARRQQHVQNNRGFLDLCRFISTVRPESWRHPHELLRMYHSWSRFLKFWTIATKDRDSVTEALVQN